MHVCVCCVGRGSAMCINILAYHVHSNISELRSAKSESRSVANAIRGLLGMHSIISCDSLNRAKIAMIRTWTVFVCVPQSIGYCNSFLEYSTHTKCICFLLDLSTFNSLLFFTPLYVSYVG